MGLKGSNILWSQFIPKTFTLLPFIRNKLVLKKIQHTKRNLEDPDFQHYSIIVSTPPKD